MGNLNDAESRDFVDLMISILETESPTLTEKGFDPLAKITELKDDKKNALDAETAQTTAEMEAKKATALARETLDKAYKSASSLVSLVEGLLGRDHVLVKKLHSIRS